MPKQDLRVVKTEQNIRKSFARLLERKSFSSITIQNILDEALINRTTFYRHYDSKYALAAAMNKDLLEQFEKLLSTSLDNRETPEGLFGSIERMAEAFYAEHKTILSLWKVHEDEIDLYADMENLMRAKFRLFLEKSASKKDNINYQTTIMTSLILTTLRFLLESKEHYTIKELTLQVGYLMERHSL